MYTSRMEVPITRFRREMKRWLTSVRRGEPVVLTDRGTPVARITRIEEPDAFQRLVDEGIITLPSRPKRPIRASDLVKSKNSVTEILLKQRRR